MATPLAVLGATLMSSPAMPLQTIMLASKNMLFTAQVQSFFCCAFSTLSPDALAARSKPCQISIFDESSSEGTFVNSVRLKPGKKRVVKGNDVVNYGKR